MLKEILLFRASRILEAYFTSLARGRALEACCDNFTVAIYQFDMPY